MNKYLEKIALSRTSSLLIDTALGGLGGGNIAFRSTHRQKKESKSHFEKRRRKNMLIGAGTGAAFLGGVNYSLNKVLRNAYKRAYNYQSSSGFRTQRPEHVNDLLKKFKTHPGNYKTKREYHKLFKIHLHKAHPDKGGSTQAFQDLSTARDKIEGSDWFKKLASLRTTNKFLNVLFI